MTPAKPATLLTPLPQGGRALPHPPVLYDTLGTGTGRCQNFGRNFPYQ